MFLFFSHIIKYMATEDIGKLCLKMWLYNLQDIYVKANNHEHIKASNASNNFLSH